MLTTSNYAALDGVLYCKHHFAQLFMEKGSYNHLKKRSMEAAPEPPPPEETTQDEQNTTQEQSS